MKLAGTKFGGRGRLTPAAGSDEQQPSGPSQEGVLAAKDTPAGPAAVYRL